MKRAAVCLLGLSAGVSAASSSPVDKVIQLLAQLKVKVQDDLQKEGAAMKEYSDFCDDEITEKGFNIKTAGADIERFQAVIEESSSKIEEFTASIAAAGAESAKKSGELAKARDVRAAENADFKAAEKELIEAVDMLSRAAVVLKRGLSLVQGKYYLGLFTV